MVVFRRDKVFPARIAELYHIPYHRSCNERKIRVGPVFKLNVLKTFPKPVRVVAGTGIVRIRPRQVWKTLGDKIKNILAPFRRVVDVKQPDDFQPFILRTGAVNVLNHLFACGVV